MAEEAGRKKVEERIFAQNHVATYPSMGGRVRLKDASSNKGKCLGVATNIYLRKTLENQKGSVNFKNKGSGVVYMRGRY